MSSLASGLESILASIPAGVVVEYSIDECGLIEWNITQKPVGFDESVLLSNLKNESLKLANKISEETQ